MAEEKEDNRSSHSCSSDFSRCSSSDSSQAGSKSGQDSSSLSCSQSLYRYEPKRAGGVYAQMMRVIRAGNNSNTVPSIRDVQVHRSNTGQSTRVETELQPTGATADLNINIIMDSDSNLSNALGGQASIEYESVDQSGASEDADLPVGGMDNVAALPVPESSVDNSAGSGGGGGADSGITGGGGAQTDASLDGSLKSPRSYAPTEQSSEEVAQPSSSIIGRADDSKADQKPRSVPAAAPVAPPVAQPAADLEEDADDDSSKTPPFSAASPRRPEPEEEDDEEDDEDEEEGGEGEEGDMDDAMRHFQRYLDGEKVDVLRGPGKDDDAKETRRKLPVGHLEKEGVVIGCMSVFADVHMKEFIVFLSDEMIQAFLIDPGRFRSVANRTKCEIEVTRRILNRRMGRYRWLKYLIVNIRGPSYSAIDQCDKMMTMLFPPYKGRKPYGAPAMVSMFLKETTPDNTDLYFNFQRTGPSQRMFGEIPLRAPFRKTKARPLESTPWKAVQKRQQWGTLEPKNDRMETVMSHVYPERGGTYTGALDHSIKWAEAAEQAVVMSKAKDMARAQMLKSRKVDSEPLFANVYGE